MGCATLHNRPLDGLEPARRPGALLVCPACGGGNAPEAVFCANAKCHKALGEFDFVIEKLRDETKWHEALAERVVSFMGTSHSVVAHGLWFLIWVAANTGLIAFVRRFDDYPFFLLGIILAAEAVVISVFVLINQNRQRVYADRRAELDYEVSVRTYREILALSHRLQSVQGRLERLEQK